METNKATAFGWSRKLSIIREHLNRNLGQDLRRIYNIESSYSKIIFSIYLYLLLCHSVKLFLLLFLLPYKTGTTRLIVFLLSLFSHLSHCHLFTPRVE